MTILFKCIHFFFSQKTFWHTIMEKTVKKNQCWQACGAARTQTNGRAGQYLSDFRKFVDGLSWNQTSELTIQLLNIINRILDMSSTKIFHGVCGSNIDVSPTWTEDTVPIYVACWHAESFKLKEINMAQKQDSFCYPPVSGSLHSR